MTNIERWTLMGAPLGCVHVTGGPSLSSPEQPDGIGVEVEVVPASQLRGAVAAFAQERQAVLDCVNLYGGETLHKALDAIGWPADYIGGQYVPRMEVASPDDFRRVRERGDST
jgi:hypothetical protein